jgi:hypothetical protein
VCLASALLFLPACTRVGDQLTGIELTHTSSPTACIKECNKKWLEDSTAEVRRSLEQLKACYQLPQGPNRTACLQAEWARFQAAMAALKAARSECANACHRQGSGSAG